MSKVTILVVEDEVLIADHLAETLEDLGYEVMEPVGTYSEAITTLEEGRPDLAILDIQLSGRKSGIDLAEKINSVYQFPFIFLSSNTDRVTLEDAKRAEPFAFLVKPYSKDELYTSIEVALYNYAKQMEKALDQDNLVIKDALFIKQNRIFLRLDFSDILYLASDHVYIDIHMTDGKKHVVRSSLNDFISKLGPRFTRCHRSFIVNLDHLRGINQNHLVLEGVEVPLGKKHRDEILKRINTG